MMMMTTMMMMMMAVVVLVVLTYCSYSEFLAYTRQKKNKTYILKPENGCQGKGIWLTKSPKDIKPQEHMLCQQYLSKVSFPSVGRWSTTQE